MKCAKFCSRPEAVAQLALFKKIEDFMNLSYSKQKQRFFVYFRIGSLQTSEIVQ